MVDKERVEKIIEEDIRPKVKADGGDIELVEVDDDIVKVKLLGACAGCPMSAMTIKSSVEQELKSQIDEIDRVEQV